MNQDWVNDWYSVGVIAAVLPGAVTRKRIGQIDLALFNLDGEIFACADICGECGQPLSEGNLNAGEVECANCGTRLQIAQGKSSSSLACYPIMVVDEEIFVLIENPSRS